MSAEYLYMIDSQPGAIYEYQLDTSTGTLTPLSGSPMQANDGNASNCQMSCGASLLADPLGRFIYYQFTYTSSGIDALSVNAQSGALSNNQQTSQNAYELAADPQGRFLYWNAGGQSDAVGALDVSSSGALTAAAGQPYDYAGQNSYGAPAVTSQYVFAAAYETASGSTQGELVEFTVDPGTGVLAKTSNSVSLTQPSYPVVTPDGQFVYVLANQNNGSEIVPIQVGSQGSLTMLSQEAQSADNASGIWMSPNGKFLYVGISGHDLWDYQINQTTGALTLVNKYTGVNEGDTWKIDPSASFAFTIPMGANNVGGTSIAEYTVNPTTGALTAAPANTVNTQVNPVDLAVIGTQ